MGNMSRSCSIYRVKLNEFVAVLSKYLDRESLSCVLEELGLASVVRSSTSMSMGGRRNIEERVEECERRIETLERAIKELSRLLSEEGVVKIRERIA